MTSGSRSETSGSATRRDVSSSAGPSSRCASDSEYCDSTAFVSCHCASMTVLSMPAPAPIHPASLPSTPGRTRTPVATGLSPSISSMAASLTSSFGRTRGRVSARVVQRVRMRRTSGTSAAVISPERGTKAPRSVTGRMP